MSSNIKMFKKYYTA